jgi:hypothetical protein
MILKLLLTVAAVLCFGLAALRITSPAEPIAIGLLLVTIVLVMP